MNHKEFLIEHYPNGFTFEPMSLRLLEERIGNGKWNDEIIKELQEQAFERSDGVYFFPEQIADDETCLNILITADDWIDRYGCFSLNALWQKYLPHIKNLTDNICDFEIFLVKLQLYKCFNVYPVGIRLARAIGTDRKLTEQKLVKHIQDRLDENYGTATEHDILNHIPALDADLLSAIVKNYLPEVLQTEINGIICYQQQEVVGIPEDLTEKINETIIQIEAVKLPVSEDAMHVILSLTYQTNFNETYQIPNKKTFRQLIDQHYHGEAREWKGGQFKLRNTDIE
ncbi:MAG: hypothetical protein LBG58_15330 [Planctomycetaceae bacterium]|jgi:hypothetical protein|nr:hypothetical protein [Planctomycetaceae bacterium]